MSSLSLLGYMANEQERLPCALHEVRATLVAPAETEGFGLAHFVDDRLLLNLRPSSVPAGASMEELVGNLRTGTFLASLHVRGEGGPYKFRTWAFAMQAAQGKEGGSAGLAHKLPDFLQRNISGDSIGEAAFHRLLSFLHEDHKVDDPNVDVRLVAAALKRTLEMLVQGVQSQLRIAMLLSNGRFFAGIQVGGGMAYNLREGILACQRCQLDRALDPFPLRESHRRFRGVMLAGGLSSIPTGFIEVPENRTVVVTRKLEVQLL